MSIEISPSLTQPKPTIKLWTPNAIGALTFFLGFPAGITLATINWIKMGMTKNVIPHIVIGVAGVIAIIFLPDNFGRIVGLALTLGYIAFFRKQMKSDIEKLERFEVQNARWYSGFFISVALYGIVLIGGIAFGVLQSVYESITPGHALYYSNRGDEYLQNGNYDNAISEYTQAIELDPSLSFLYFNRGIAYREKADYGNAISDFTSVIRLNPKDSEAYFERAKINLIIYNFNGAIPNFSKVIEINPNNAYAFYGRGLAYEQLKMTEEAMNDFEQALEITNDQDLKQAIEAELQILKGQ